jgi:hypothetical protein
MVKKSCQFSECTKVFLRLFLISCKVFETLNIYHSKQPNRCVMKSMTSHFKLAFGALALVFMAAACRDKVIQEYTYTVNTPIYQSHEEFQNRVITSEPRDLESPGKIHFKGNMIYIVEQYKGIHVIDNSNPSSPQKTSFVELPGVVDLASKDFTLYADSYTDLVALDISNPTQITELGRETNVFAQSNAFFNALPPTNNEYGIGVIEPEKGVVVGWKVETITEEYEVSSGGLGCWNCDFAVSESASDVRNGFAPTAAPAAGISGSMARFAVNGNALYVLDQWSLKVLDISNTNNPTEGEVFETGLQVETLFPLDGKLFVGTTTGMMIYDLANPMSPVFLTTFAHASSCDPVVVEGDIAYVTLRSGTECQGFTNQLDVINVSDFSNPSLIKSYPMTNPHGLGIDNGTLFICDGDAGLKVFDASDANRIDENELSHFENINAYDVIPLGNVLLMVGADGFYQYDYSDVQNIQLLSVIPVIL